MRLSAVSPAAAAGAAHAGPELLTRAEGVVGFDISNYQSDVDFQGAYNRGARFVIIKIMRSIKGTAYIDDSFDTHNNETGRYPLIYTNNDWWSRCAGDSDAFSDTCPLVLASYASEVGTIPGGWETQTIWQNSDAYEFGGDSDLQWR